MKKIKKYVYLVKDKIKEIILKPFKVIERKIFESYEDFFEIDFADEDAW